MKMSQDEKFRQQWEFRRRDDDLDFSRNDSKSSSSGEPLVKKHKLVSNLILPENEESSYDPGVDFYFDLGKVNTTRVGLRKKIEGIKDETKRGSMKEGNTKKSKHSTQEPVSLDDFKIFAESILEELKVEQQNIFARMREEMKKLVAVDSASRPTGKEGGGVQKAGQAQHHNSIGLGMRTQNFSGGSLERSAPSNRTTEVFEERVNHGQAIETITSNEKDKGERLRLSVKKSLHSSNHSDQIVSSPYLTLSEPRVEQHRIGTSSRNCINPGVAGNSTNVSFGRANLMTDSSTHDGYFSSIQTDEQFGSFARMGSKNMGCYDQHSAQTSSMGTGFPVPLVQRLDNSLNIPSQVVLENSSRDNNIPSPRMNGGAVRIPGGSRTLSNHFVANNFRIHMNFRTNGGLKAFGTQELKDGLVYPSLKKEG